MEIFAIQGIWGKRSISKKNATNFTLSLAFSFPAPSHHSKRQANDSYQERNYQQRSGRPDPETEPVIQVLPEDILCPAHKGEQPQILLH